MKAIPYGKQEITAGDIEAVTSVLNADFLTQGPQVQAFEKAFSEYVGAEYAVAVSNGTAALHLSAIALGVNGNSRVITTSITFAATSNCILYCGGQVEFADIDPATGTLDPDAVERMILSKPKGYYQGIIPVDLAGYPVNLEKFGKLAKEHGLWVLEDACHAPGAYYLDSSGTRQKCGNGSTANLSIFSFHPVKHIATGEGGMITTNDPVLYHKLLKLRTHGITKDRALLENYDGEWYYEMQDLGFNYRIPDILCALGISQLSRADERLDKRISIARKYDKAFSSGTVVTPLTPISHLEDLGIKHAYHLYVIRTKQRLRLFNYLRERKILTQVHYIPLYRMPYYRKLGFLQSICPNAEAYYHECLSLPMFPSLRDDEQQYVIDTINQFSDHSI